MSLMDWLADLLAGGKRRRLDRALALRTSPLNVSQAYREHWALLMTGEEDRARAILDELTKKGVPLPEP